MSVVLVLKPRTEELLRRAVKARGLEMNGYLESLIEKDYERLSLEERLKPVREGFETSGMTEEELDDFMNGILRKVRSEKRQKRG